MARIAPDLGVNSKGNKIYARVNPNDMDLGVALSAAHLKFVDYYMETLDARNSASRAGFSKTTAPSLVNRCAKEIKRRMCEVRMQSVANAQEVLEFFTNVMRGKVKQKTLMVVNGRVSEYETDVRVIDRLKAAEFLAKHYNLFIEAAKITEQPILEDNIPIDIEQCEVLYETNNGTIAEQLNGD